MLNHRVFSHNGYGQRWRPLCALASVCLLFSLAGGAQAVTPGTGEVPPDPPWLEELPDEREPGASWCRYPHHEISKRGAVLRRAREVAINEVEPNDLPSEAQFLTISSEVGNELDLDVTGTIAPGADLDYYRFSARQGDVIGLAVLAEEPLDPMVGIYELNGAPLIENDDHRGIEMVYPPESPFIGGDYYYYLDSALTWVVPADGNYLIRVCSFASASNGNYTLDVITRRPGFEHKAVGATQVLYIDFDGADDVNARLLDDRVPRFAVRVSPMQYFLGGWGLTLEDEALVVDAILAVVEENFNDLRLRGLNGDRDADFIDGHFDVEIRNSRDHPEPWGEPDVSRVVVGGTIEELGIPTLGIAQSIDPGNFATEETAVVLLDLLSSPRFIWEWREPDPEDPEDEGEWILVPNPYWLDSINSLTLAPAVTIIDAIGEVLGNIVTHEAAHYLGLWHTDNANEIHCIIDTGGDGIANEAGVGRDGVFGTADDVDVDFVVDEYDPYEYVAEGFENTDLRTSYALSTGIRLDLPPPPLPPEPEVARASIRAMPMAGQAPLTVQFAGGGIDPEGGEFLIFNWDFGDGVIASGPLVNHTYTMPGTYLVTLTATTSSAQTAQATVQIIASSEPNEPPLARVVATPRSGPPPLVVLFEADARDLDGAVIYYDWDFGDGSTGSGRITEHVYIDPGIYVVTLTVTDDRGASNTATEVVTVILGGGSGSTAAAMVPGVGDDAAAPLPLIGECGAGAPGAVMAGLTIILGLTAVRRRW